MVSPKRKDRLSIHQPETMATCSKRKDLFCFLKNIAYYELPRIAVSGVQVGIAKRTSSIFVHAVALLLVAPTAYTQTQNLFFIPPTYSGSGEIATADFNGDGKPDLVSGDGTVLLGKGDGTFDTVTALGTQGNSIGTADCNGDGKPDVLGISAGVFVLLGKTDGNLR